MSSTSTSRRSRRRLLPAAPAWLIVLFLALVQRATTVRDGRDRGEAHTVAIVVFAVAALVLAVTVGPKIAAWVSEQMSVFG